MGEKTGPFGSVCYEGNSINIDILPNTLGSLALTHSGGRIECYWDGNQWVCTSLTFDTQSQNQSQSAAPTSA